ncbi:MAG: adenosine deaminase [Thermoplasmata archaeon]|nr:adenosine deaminase [Thermoplasmata archaeon]
MVLELLPGTRRVYPSGRRYHPWMRELAALPKVELHIHLEGSIRADTLREIADRRGLPLPEGLTPDGWRFRGFMHFIDQYMRLCSLFTELEDFRRIAEEFCEDLAADHVRYAEAVFSPANHAARLGGDWFGPIEAVLDGLAAGEREHGVVVRLCPDIVRDLGFEDAEHTLEVALKYAGEGVVALGCAGSERTGIEPFAPLFRRAREGGLRSVPHAGEWAGPQNVWDTIENYVPDRIGHGVRAIEDPRLVETLAASGLPLEVCPTSNVATGVYPSLAEHPFERLRAAGVTVTLNSDDPALFGSRLSEVYAAARDQWGYGDDDLADLAKTAARCSFAESDLARALVADIDAWAGGPESA